MLTQLNKIHNDIANRVAEALGVDLLQPDSEYYHDNVTKGLSIFGEKLPTIATLKVGVLASLSVDGSVTQGKELKDAFAAAGVLVTVIAEKLAAGVDSTYAQADATAFDGVIVASGAEGLFNGTIKSPLYPAGRPAQLVIDSYRWGKPVGGIGKALNESASLSVKTGEGVYFSDDVNTIVDDFKEGLATFRFTDRFATD